MAELGDKIIWSKIMYFGAHTAPPLFLIFALDYTHRRKWLTRLNLALLFVLPSLTIMFAATNEWHHLIWTGFSPSPGGSNLYIYQHGIWFWVATVYINFVLFVGTFFFFQFALRSKELYRFQNVALVIAALFPWLGFVIYLLNASPFPGLDITAISFTFTGAILVFTISRLHFLDVIPIAREVLIETMLDGMLVLDEQNRIVDMNPAARQIFKIDLSVKWIGQPIEAFLPDHLELVHNVDHSKQVEIEWRPNLTETRTFDLQVSPLYDRTKRLTGKSIVFRDITSHKNTERALQQVNQQLEEKLVQIEKLKDELRDQVIRDELTGLFNHRYLGEVFSRELAQAARGGYPLSVVIIDLDHFKEHNDTYGHMHGDDLLRTLGGILRTQFRAGDIACRYGGDEFILIMPNSPLEDTFQRVEGLHLVCQYLSLDRPDDKTSITFSAGIATYPTHAKSTDDLLRIADRALYKAKSLGRNRTCFP